MASSRHHRVTQKAIVTGLSDDHLDPNVRHHLNPGGLRGHLNLSLTDGRARIRSSRRYADTFHSYETTDRTGTRIHVAYARYLPGSPKHGFSKVDPDLDVTYVYEIPAEAVAAAFGLAPTT